ncbi:Hpt domain-containing protein [Sphingobium boeckii]|uniref:HPt (Histidine-containing phosphotransfer) domain-containing protein n=1 Tax=Sphingobium boeckii TaxID=1082345 RepID=A0A7W9EHH5_9SPHN|nr:HPt (histidine-containing phosphotransfer) domain-containing protein [Sphingobium boeckii]
MTPTVENKIDWPAFLEARQELGADFIRILGYFREDGTKSVAAIETAMRAKDAAAMVVPAHTLKGESLQFGAETLAGLAEQIEAVARHCVEVHEAPDELLEQVVQLRPVFEEALLLFERECNPLVERRNGGFGRKVDANNQSFGRI